MPAVSVQSDTDVVMQVSMNGYDWHDVMNPETGKSYHYYPTPHVTSVTPAFGHVKAIKDQTIDVAGTGFRCSILIALVSSVALAIHRKPLFT
jgi:hypothetical protein